MFVESMSFEEIRQEFERDKMALVNKIVAHGFSLEKMMRKTNMTIFDKYYDYVSPRKNRWVHHFTSHPVKKGKLKVDMYAHFATRRSYAVVYYSLDAGRLTYCTSHFLRVILNERSLNGMRCMRL